MTTLEEKFLWAIPSNDEEIKSIWDEATITVDTNVLLDLYRVHKDTRESILSCLESFKGKLWLSNQAAIEFFNNRNKVISEARKDFGKGKNIIEDLHTHIQGFLDGKINGNRAISKDFIHGLNKSLSDSCKEITKKYLEDLDNIDFSYSEDPVLLKIIELFNNNLGLGFDSDDLEKMKKEAQRRIENKIPPGFEDAKTKDDASGDYFIWEQVLRYAEKEEKSVILITSERKSDWWEIYNGESSGLHPFLKREAYQRTKQKILVYHTTNFLDQYKKYLGKTNEDGNKSKLSSDKLTPSTDVIRSLVAAISDIQDLDLQKDQKSRYKNLPTRSHYGTVSNIIQNVEFSSETTNIGIIECFLTREVPFFTVSGKFKPRMLSSPNIDVELITAPVNISLEPHANTGTTHDFNIHMGSRYNQNLLPVGEYVFKYTAYTENDSSMIGVCPECSGVYLFDANQCIECGLQAETQCLRCGNEMTSNDLDTNPFCNYCNYLIEKESLK